MQACLCMYNFVLYMSFVCIIYSALHLIMVLVVNVNGIKLTRIFCCVQVSEPTSTVVVNAREIKVSEATFSG